MTEGPSGGEVSPEAIRKLVDERIAQVLGVQDASKLEDFELTEDQTLLAATPSVLSLSEGNRLRNVLN